MTVLRIPCSYDCDTDNTTKLATGTTLRVGLSGTTVYRAALKFSVADLPASCDISRVELEVSVRAAGEASGKWDIRPLGTNGVTDPATQTAAQLYTACATGTPYVNDSALFRHGGRHRILLGLGTGATACTDVETAAAAVGDIFSLGLMEQGDDDAYCELEAVDYADSDYYAELIVTYNETASEQTLLQELAQRIDPAHYETGTLTTSSASVPADTGLNHPDAFWRNFWLLLLAGTYIGESRKVQNFVSSTGVMTLAKEFTGVSGAVAYCLLPTQAILMARAFNAAIAEGFPQYLYLPMAWEMGVDTRHIYDVPAGMLFVDRVEYRYDGDDKEWYVTAFEKIDDTRVQITAGHIPTSGIVVRLTGRQRLTQLDQTDALALTGTTEITTPDAFGPLKSEWLFKAAERNIRKSTRPEEVPSPPVGSADSVSPSGKTRSSRLALLEADLLSLEEKMTRLVTGRRRYPIRNPMP